MSKTVDYRLLTPIQGSGIDPRVTLDERVREHLAAGWELFGNPFVLGSSPAQAVVKIDRGGTDAL